MPLPNQRRRQHMPQQQRRINTWRMLRKTPQPYRRLHPTIDILNKHQLQHLKPDALTTYIIRLCAETPHANHIERVAIQKEIVLVRAIQARRTNT
jgi:hypothetical protein